jgi:hypothetical protein
VARLDIAYLPSYWVHPLRAEIAKTPALADADKKWSNSPLFDLAFSLETRVGNLREIARQTDENLKIVAAELNREQELATLIEGGYAYQVRDEVALRRVIIGLGTLAVESRSCFENLTRFYRQFVRNYFNETISEDQSYAKVAACGALQGPALADPDGVQQQEASGPPTRASDSQWAETLRLNRNDMVHYRAPWLRFEVQAQPRHYQAILILEYRLNTRLGPQDEISLDALKAIQGHLRIALDAIRDELIERVKALQ